MVIFRKTIISKVPEGVKHFPGGGGPTFPGGGVQMLISIKICQNRDFPVVGSGPPIPTPDPRMFCLHL